MAFCWLPNIADFFFSLARLIEDSERQLNSASYDSLEFLVRRLDEYERTSATLTSRFCETYDCVPAQQNTVADLSYLCNRVAFLRSHFQRSLDCEDNSVVVSTPGNIRPLQIEHCNRPGRPRLAITQGQLEALQRDSGFRWSDVARILCVSARTLRRRRHELGMLVESRQFSELTDTQLDDLTSKAGVTSYSSCRSEDGTRIPKTAWPRCSKNSRSACVTKGGSSHFCTEECSENY